MKNLLIRTLTGILFITIVIISLFVPFPFFYLLFLLFSLIGSYEFILIVRNKEQNPSIYLTLLFAGIVYSSFFFMAHDFLFPYLLFGTLILALLIPIVELYRKEPFPVFNISFTYLSAIWIAIPFGMLGWWAHGMANGNKMVLALLIVIWMYDTFAYCGGSLFGKHRLFERISPKKSWEGFVIAFLLTVSASIAFYYIPFFQQIGFDKAWKWILFAVIIIIASTYGDLLESFYKRTYEVKDSGNILPGHGGVLDRFDSLLFATPVAFLYCYFLL